MESNQLIPNQPTQDNTMNEKTKEFLKQFHSPDGLFSDWCALPTKPCRCVVCGAVTTPDCEGFETVHAVFGPEVIDVATIKTEADFKKAVSDVETACWQCHSDQVGVLVSERSIAAAHWLGLCDFDGNQHQSSDA